MLDLTIKRGYQKRSQKVEQLETECQKGMTGEVTEEKLEKVIHILDEIEQLTEEIHSKKEELKKFSTKLDKSRC